MDLNYTLRDEHLKNARIRGNDRLVCSAMAESLTNEISGLMSDNMIIKASSITIDATGKRLSLSIEGFSALTEFFSRRKIKIYFVGFYQPKTNFRQMIGEFELQNHHEVLNHGLVATMTFLRHMQRGMNFDPKPPKTRLELVSTHDCPKCNTRTYCAISDGKSINACHCFHKSSTHYKRSDDYSSEICLCQKCL